MEPIKKIIEDKTIHISITLIAKIDEIIDRINYLTKVKPVLIIKLPYNATKKGHLQTVQELNNDNKIQENYLYFVIIGDKEIVEFECFNSFDSKIELEELRKKITNSLTKEEKCEYLQDVGCVKDICTCNKGPKKEEDEK